MSIWFIKGIPDDRHVKASVNRAGRIVFSTGGSINVRWKLESQLDTAQFLLPGPIPRNVVPDLIVNEISNPETHGNALDACAKLCDRYDCDVINDPRIVKQTYRDLVADKLEGISGLDVPATIRCSPSCPDEVLELVADYQLGETVLMRETGKHGGDTLEKLTLPDDAARLHRFAYDGREFYITRYVDYRDDDGYYRKFRLVCVGDKVLPRHMLISGNWMVHASARAEMEQHPHLVAEELDVMSRFNQDIMPKVAPTLRALQQAIGLDYLGADCHIAPDGTLLLFEANPNMNITLNTRKDKATAEVHIDAILDAFRELLQMRANSDANPAQSL